MLLRSLTKHVKDQNWSAISIDFFIVVVGVFIGIQVANWNDVRIERLLESETLVALREDIQATSLNINTVLREAKIANNSLKTLAEFADGNHNDLSISEIDQHILFGVYAILTFDPSMVTYDELKNTGRLGLIKAKKLRKFLQLLASQINTLETEELSINKAAFNFTDKFLLKNYDWRGFVTIPSRKGSYSVDWLDPLKNRRDPKTTLRQPEFINLVLYRGRLNKSFESAARILGKTLDQIDTLITNRLNEIDGK